MLPEDSIPGAAIPPESALQRADERVRIRLALTRDLQASLSASHKALLALDLRGIERGTSEQVGLSRKLAEDLRRGRVSPAREKRLAEELRQSEREVWQAARLQAALLARAQCKLRVLSNMLADPSVNYGPLLTRSGAPPHASHFKRGGEI
ncbi:MAG: hypothetical protein WCA49_23760 [Candidatus Sulfotelmatobacter sp.]